MPNNQNLRVDSNRTAIGSPCSQNRVGARQLNRSWLEICEHKIAWGALFPQVIPTTTWYDGRVDLYAGYYRYHSVT